MYRKLTPYGRVRMQSVFTERVSFSFYLCHLSDVINEIRLLLDCHPKGHKSKIVNGDSIYGVITLVSSCTLWFNSPVGGDYILEFADLNTG